ncbi:MAG: ABC transporter substrate-binding protein [Candidatus Tectomicrobia bacterium]|nr:ABC transporter substrate-binding protein [Candidatus Tectomicrobia bacterium]
MNTTKVMRALLLVSFAAVVALSLAMPGIGGSPAEAQQKPPIKIGVLYGLTGVYAFPSKHGVQGAALAFEEANYQVAGRKIETIVEDDQSPQVAVGVTKARKLVEKDRVHAVMGIIWSPTGVAVSDYMKTVEVPLVLTEAAARIITQEKRHPYVFRTSFASGQMTLPFSAYVCKNLGYKRIVTFAFDSVFGREQADYVAQGCEQGGGKVIKQLFAPVRTPDMAPYLAQIQAENPDAVWALWSGIAAIQFLRQYKEFGLKGKYPLLTFGSLSGEDVLAQVPDAAEGMISYYFYTTAYDAPENKAFVEAYTKKYNMPPAVYAGQGYLTAKVILAALEAIKGNVEDKAAFLAALRNVSFERGIRGPWRFDAFQNAVSDVYVFKVERGADGKVGHKIIHVLKNAEQYWPQGKPQR